MSDPHGQLQNFIFTGRHLMGAGPTNTYNLGSLMGSLGGQIYHSGSFLEGFHGGKYASLIEHLG